MLFPVVQTDDTLKEAFANFQQDPLNNFKVHVRRVRAAQLRSLLSNPASIDLNTFQNEVWNIESRTRLRENNTDFHIFRYKKTVTEHRTIA